MYKDSEKREQWQIKNNKVFNLALPSHVMNNYIIYEIISVPLKWDELNN